jgi:hypothetical protein
MSEPNAIISFLEEHLIPLLIGTIGGASARAWFSTQQKIEENTLNMHREFFGESMYKARTLSEKLIEEYPEKTLEEIRREVHPDKCVHLWMVLGFFNRLSLQTQQNQIRKKYIRDLFGELFVWWWVCAFDNGRLPEEWDSYKSIKWFKEWLENPFDKNNFNYAKRLIDKVRKVMNEEKDQKRQFKIWYIHARNDRDKVLSKGSSQ